MQILDKTTNKEFGVKATGAFQEDSSDRAIFGERNQLRRRIQGYDCDINYTYKANEPK